MNIFAILLTIFIILFLISAVFLIILLKDKRRFLKEICSLKKSEKESLFKIEELRKQINEYREEISYIIAKIPYGIVLLDKDLKISYINDSIANLLYINKENAIGTKTIYIFNNKNLEDLIENSLQYFEPQKGNLIFYGEEEISLDVEVIPFALENFRVLILFKNVTQEFEFSKLRSQFVANVSHEMRTPLTSVKGYIETILDFNFDNLDNSKNEKEKLKQYLSKALVEIERLNVLIKDILKLSDIEYKRNILIKQPVEVVSSIKDVIESLNFLVMQNNSKIFLNVNKKSINDINEYNDLKDISKVGVDNNYKIFINSDQELFNQLVKNMVENSIFHGGPDTEIFIDINETDSNLILTFLDNGAGISKNDLPFIFQRFYRGKSFAGFKNIGSGLGLSIVKHIVELHKGSINVSSYPKKETKFVISLPKN